MDEPDGKERPATDPASYNDVRVRLESAGGPVADVVKVLACSSCYNRGYSYGFFAGVFMVLVILGAVYLTDRCIA